jgi:hypothetical protein
VALKFWQGEQEHPTRTLERPSRITKLTTSELKEWLDIEIMNLGQAYDQWRHHSRGADEVSTRLDMLAAMWDELSEREE